MYVFFATKNARTVRLSLFIFRSSINRLPFNPKDIHDYQHPIVLSAEGMAQITGLERNERLANPDGLAPDWASDRKSMFSKRADPKIGKLGGRSIWSYLVMRIK